MAKLDLTPDQISNIMTHFEPCVSGERSGIIYTPGEPLEVPEHLVEQIKEIDADVNPTTKPNFKPFERKLKRAKNGKRNVK